MYWESRPVGISTRIVVVDDQPDFPAAIKNVLGEQSDLEVVGEASDGREAAKRCHRLRPDLVLMDVRMPRVANLEATRTIKGESPSPIVLVLGALEEPNDLSEALKAGAGGYVLKTAPIAEIIDAVRKVFMRVSSLSQEDATRLLMYEKPPRPNRNALAWSQANDHRRSATAG